MMLAGRSVGRSFSLVGTCRLGHNVYVEFGANMASNMYDNQLKL